jgi:type II secretory pathway component PulF
MIRSMRRLGIFLLILCAPLSLMSAMLQGTSLGDQLLRGVFLTIPVCFCMQIPHFIRSFWHGPRLPPRPRQRSQSLLKARGSWGACNVGLVTFWLGALLCDLLMAELNLGGLLLLLSLPVALFLFVHQMMEPGANAERRVLAAQLSAGLQADLPLPDLLEELQRDAGRGAATRFRDFPAVLHWLAFDLRCGSLFSTAVATQSYFPPIWSSLLRIGERTGRLPECLTMLEHWEANQPRRLYLLRPLIGLPIVLLLSRAVADSSLFSPDLLPPSPLLSAISPLYLFIVFSFGLALLSLLGQWLRRFPRLRQATDQLQRMPWVEPLARVEEQLLAITALEATAHLQGSLEEMLELAQSACTRTEFRRALEPQRAGAGDTLGEILKLHFEPVVVTLVASGEVRGDLSDGLSCARLYLKDRLEEERERVELRFLVAFQVLTGLLVLASALEFLYSLQSVVMEWFREA